MPYYIITYIQRYKLDNTKIQDTITLKRDDVVMSSEIFWVDLVVHLHVNGWNLGYIPLVRSTQTPDHGQL